MSRYDIKSRRGLTFGQAEGVQPLPKQLGKGELPIRLRSRLWDQICDLIDGTTFTNGDYQRQIEYPWWSVMRDHFVDTMNHFGDNFPKVPDDAKNYVRTVIQSASYIEVFNLIQSLIAVDPDFGNISNQINSVLQKELSAYRVYDKDIIAAMGSDADAETISNALEQTTKVGAQGPRSHIRNAIQALNNNDFSGSVRESIGAVESISKILAQNPKTELGLALSALEKSANIHGGMKAAFVKLYGYTSDEKGIRHALLFEGKANVDESDALFMVGACSAFVTYLINRANEAGISVSGSA